MSGQQEHGPKLYLGVWIGLLVLTTATYALGQLPLGPWHMPVGLGIAVVKAGLVVWFFMHLGEHQGSNRLVLATALIFVALLTSLVVGDVSLRFKGTQPPGPYPLDLRPGSPPMHHTSPSDTGFGPERKSSPEHVVTEACGCDGALGFKVMPPPVAV